MDTQLPSLVKSLSFNDIDQLAGHLKSFQWSVDQRQIERGTFGGDLLIAHLAGIQVAWTAYNRGIRSWGDSPKGMMVIAIPLSAPPLLHWHGHSVSNNAVILQRSTHGVDLVRKGTFSLGIVAIDLNDLLKVAYQTNQSSVESLLLGDEYVIYPNLTALEKFRCHLQTLFTLVQQQPKSLLNLKRQILIQQETTFLSLNLLDVEPNNYFSHYFSRYKLIQQAEKILLENLNHPLTIYDLCTQLHVSERTLYYGFQEYFGMSPMAYFKVYRLNGVRRQLNAVSGEETTVTDIATQWGFWHLGQFSQDYKKMFGESPSETLRRG